MSFDDLVRGKQVIAVVCDQWGDTGKGKFSDYFAANWADVIARGTGGNNAGHTVVINGKKRIFHLIPAGILYDKEGKVNVLGNGMVLNLEVLCGELDSLENDGLSHSNLMISSDAHVILPYHVNKDSKANSGGSGIGTTGRGIGPCYEDKIGRRGVMVRDLFDSDVLCQKLVELHEHHGGKAPRIDDMMSELSFYGGRIKHMVRDTLVEMRRFWKEGRKMLLEGAQGLLLSIEFGTYPYVTSSDCSINGTAAGAGLSAKDVDICLGVVKFPYMTRVGNGPFPTELGGELSEKYCAKGLEHDISFELKTYGVPFSLDADKRPKYDPHHPTVLALLNSEDPFGQGVGLRLAGGEYGATTGRPRRTGWTDLVALRYAVGINGPDMILTKPDVLQGADSFKLCAGYGSLDDFTRDSAALRRVEPSCISFDGFCDDLSEVEKYGDLPSSLRKAIETLEDFTAGRVRIISTGPDQKENIFR